MRDDRGQMMMLTAVILIISFLALAGMSSRVAQLPEQATLERQDVFFDEAGRIVDGVRAAFQHIGSACPDVDWMDGINATMAHIVLVEAGRGYYLQHEETGCDSGQEYVLLRLADARHALELRVNR